MAVETVRWGVVGPGRIAGKVVRDFAAHEIAPHAEAWDRDHVFPVEAVTKMGELGLFGLPFPEEYGGGGADLTTLCIAIEEIARVDQSVAIFSGLGDAGFVSWMLTAKVFGLLGFPVLYAGLARAGVISWWLVVPSVLPMVVFALVPGALGIALATACTAAAFVTGWRLVQRGRLAG